MSSSEYQLRPIELKDNPQVADLIRVVMTEMGAAGPGFSINDPEVDMMFEASSQDGSQFYVIESGERIMGIAGYARLAGAEPGVCELQKMYFYPEIRGLGIGRVLIERILQEAKAAGYVTCYIETLESMRDARALYEKYGFKEISTPLGATGHCSCDTYMSVSLV